MKTLFATALACVTTLLGVSALPQETRLTTAQKQLIEIQCPPDIEITRVVRWDVVDDNVATLEISNDGLSTYVIAGDAGETWVTATIEATAFGDSYFYTSTFQVEVSPDPPPSLPFWFLFSTPEPK